jgi:hypothetical protein
MRIFFTLTCLLSLLCTQAQKKITVVDLYGNYTIPAATIRSRLGLTQGDTLNAVNTDSFTKKLKSLPGVHDASTSLICCDQVTGGVILFIGIAESDKYIFSYHQAPAKKIELPAEITATSQLLQDVKYKAALKGNTMEDNSMGHTLSDDSTARKLQLKYVEYARRYMPQLKEVLYQSSNPWQRSLATEIIAYTDDKKMVVTDLLYVLQDPDEGVRNNAARALGVMGSYGNEHPEAGINIPAAPFMNMLHSAVWTDRNKASWTLLSLTQKRDPALLKALKQDCLPALAEMAAWKSSMHALANYFIVARMAGVSDDDAYKEFSAANKNAFLKEMIATIREDKK